MKHLNRRDFLKLASLTSLAALTPNRLARQEDRPNILIVVFDAWSYKNIGMFGYPRQTMPRLEELAESAVVYHNHYAAGPWTIPGTASLLTGTYPWTHRVFNAEQIHLRQRARSLFALLQQAGYTTAGASHNIYADDLLSQLNRYLDVHPRFMEMFLPTRFPLTRLFNRDLEASGLAQLRAFWNKERVHSAAFLGDFLQRAAEADIARIEAEYGRQFPGGVPAIPVLDLHFLLEDGIDHLIETTAGLPQPHLSYYHFYPPHQPYRTRQEFHNRFRNDSIEFPQKPASVISEGHTHKEELEARRQYDETLLYVDAEFHRLYTTLKAAGRLENTWLILTSDHGELFERGNIGHETPIAYDPEVHIPLMIFPPGHTARTDMHALTSAVDLLPTILEIAGLPTPEWAEGRVLPPFNPQRIQADRSVFVLHPESSRARQPISEGSAAIIKGNLKLIYTFGLKGLADNNPFIELYDLEADPEELINLYSPAHPEGQTLLAELLERIERADQPYR